MKKSEILFIIALLIPLIPMSIGGQWWLFSVFLLFYLCFALLEFVSVKVDGKSISQKFWAFSEKNKPLAIIILVTMVLMWAGLIYHLSVKLL